MTGLHFRNVQIHRDLETVTETKTWPEGALSALKDCFKCTDWDVLKHAGTYDDYTDLEKYTSVITSYTGKCIDDVNITKTITIHPKLDTMDDCRGENISESQ